MDFFTAASHHDVLVLVIQVAVLLFSARALGEIAQRFNQPAVVGEILAGILLGPTLLSGIFPELGQWILPQTEVQGYLLEVVSLIGAMFLLLITGLETDLKLIRHHARTAIGVSAGGIIVTFATGFMLGQYLPDFLVADPDRRIVFELFVATSMSISAIPVIAKVLMDLNLMRRDIGQTIIAAGMSDDTTGWILLSIVAGLASGEAVTTGSVLQAVGSVLAFMIISFTAGRWLVKKLLIFVQDEVKSHDRLLTLVVVMTFTWGAITQALNLEAVLGAFVMGILFGSMPRLPDNVHTKLESIALGVFAPIFFGVAGLKVNAANLLDPTLLAITALVIFVATAGKIIGTYTGARLIGRKKHWQALSFGAGLNARGAMEIIIATIGLQLGILTQDMYSIIVVMAMATSLMAPTALRWALKHVRPDKEETERLKKEEIEAESLVANIHRVLLPVRRRDQLIDMMSIQSVEAQLMERLGSKTELSVTLMTVISDEQVGREKCNRYLRDLSNLFSQEEIVTKIVEHKDAGEAILEEAHKDYDLLVLGATETKQESSSILFNPLVDYLVRVAPCPTMVVQADETIRTWAPQRILVPTNGAVAARRAAEFAFYIASEDQEVIILNVALKESTRYRYKTGDIELTKKRKTGIQIVNDLIRLGEAQHVKTRGEVIVGDATEDSIHDFSKQESVDLIILGTDIRPGSDRLFFGPRVEAILHEAECPVVVLNT